MKIFFTISLLLGSVVVFQPMLNRMVLELRGLTFAVWMNACVLFLMASLLCALVYFFGAHLPEMFHFKAHHEFPLWFLVPGLLGFIFVFAVPLMFQALGAFPTVLAMLCGQMVTSFLVDVCVYGVPVSLSKVLGLAMAASGAYLSLRPE